MIVFFQITNIFKRGTNSYKSNYVFSESHLFSYIRLFSISLFISLLYEQSTQIKYVKTKTSKLGQQS